MLTRMLVFLSIVLLSAKTTSSESYLVKCCPSGQLYSGSSQIDCALVPNNTVELHFFHLNASAEPQGHPLCVEPEDYVTMALDDFVPGEYLEESACLEVLHDQKTRDSVLVVVHCRSDEDRRMKAINASFPQITHIRKCCPHDTIFDKRTRACVSWSNNTSSLLMFLPNEIVDEDRVVIATEGPPKCKGPIVDYEIDENDVFLRNGTYSVMIPILKHDPIVKEEYFVIKDNACFDTTPDSASNRRLIVRVCRDREYCDKNICIRKCCAENRLFYTGGCRKHIPDVMIEKPIEFHPIFERTINATSSSTFDIIKDYGLLIGKPCQYGMFPLNPAEDRWSLTSQGHLKFNYYPVANLDNYCTDVYYNDSHYNTGLHLFMCYDKSVTEQRDTKISTKVNIALQFTSCVFLLITLLVYACLPSLQNLHGKTLMCHVSSLFLAFICLAVIPWITPIVDKGDPKVAVPCKVLAYMMLFFLLSAFSWLNVMCFDIWWTFGGLRGDTVTRGRKHKRRFLLYCLYAWSFSFLVSISAIIFDYTEILPIYLRPNLGFTSCWFSKFLGSYGEVIFFISPVTIQLISNVVFFVLTSVHCNKVKAEIRRVTADPADPRSKQFHSDHNRFIMNIKLFIVMGISWICEVISFFLKRYRVDWQEAIFYTTDVFNCLQGLLIFILFVLKSRVYLALRRRLGLDVRQKRACNNTTTLQDPYRVRKSVSNSTIMSTFAVSSAP